MFLGATVVYTGRWAETWIMLVLALKLNPASFPPMILNPKGSLPVFRRTKLWISFISGGLSRRGGKMCELENEIQIRKVARAHFPTFEFPRARPTEFNSHSPSGFRFRAQTEFTARERETHNDRFPYYPTTMPSQPESFSRMHIFQNVSGRKTLSRRPSFPRPPSRICVHTFGRQRYLRVRFLH